MRRKNIFPEIEGKVFFNEPLSRHTTFRIGGPCRIWAEPAGEEDLRKILRFADAEKEKIFIIGNGSNILFKASGFDGILIHLGGEYFKKTSFEDTKTIAGAGAMLASLINLTCENGLSGMEGLAGIPGTVGGAIFMNSSYKVSISDLLEEVKVMERSTGNVEFKRRESLKFGYRDSGELCNFIILEATLRLAKSDRETLLKRKDEFLNAKRNTQPLESFSAGCVFKNPGNGKLSAAEYIDKLRLKGKKIGDAQVSEKHANFIVNTKKARGKDVLRLINFIRKQVKSQFGVDLDTEIIIV